MIPAFEVQRRMCRSCIYRKGSPLNLKDLEAQVADPHMPGFFWGYRVCHHAPNRRQVCCAGFWRRWKDHFELGQIAQRLGLVRKVSVDRGARTKLEDRHA